MHWLYGTWAVFEKDLRLELRSRYAVSTLLMFVVAALLLVLFAIGQSPVSSRVEAALLWVVILFAAALGLGRSFIAEEERGTVLLLQLNTRGSMVYAGKLLFNYLLILTAGLVALGALLLMLGVVVAEPLLLLAVLLLGTLGLAGTTTLLAALIARAANQGPLLPVLLFPLLVPLLLSVVSATRESLPNGLGWAGARDELTTLVGFTGVVITVSVLLFDYVWNE
jgi:heme exporter protein B